MNTCNHAVVFSGPGEVCVEERPVPVPGAHEILVETICSMISPGTELTVLRGKYSPDSAWGMYGRFPFCPGYNNIGRVVSAGAGVDAAWIGKKVATCGPHAAFIVSSTDDARIVEKEIPDECVAFFSFAEICMNGVRRGGVTWGERIAVYGLGLLGQMTVRLCRLAGARTIVGIDTNEFRLGRLPGKPGVAGLNPQRTNVREEILTLTRGEMADVVFEVTGKPELLSGEFAVLREQGRLVVLSSPSGPAPMFDFHDLCNAPSFTIIGAHNRSHPIAATFGNPWTKQRHFELFLEYLSRGDLDVNSLITHRIFFAEAPEMYRTLLAGGYDDMLGVIITWR